MLQMAANRVLPPPPPLHYIKTPPPLLYSTCNTKRSPLPLIAECSIELLFFNGIIILPFLIAALIFSAGFYSDPIFTTRRRVLEKSFLINFIGVIFEAGNETREKIWSDFGAEQK